MTTLSDEDLEILLHALEWSGHWDSVVRRKLSDLQDDGKDDPWTTPEHRYLVTLA